ncbi:MAG: DUF962 domain-containing protein [Candidatus Tyrphobacter sp.]
MTKGELFREYAAYHSDPRNRLCHAFGIPLIVLGIFGLCERVRLGPIDLAIVLAALILIVYARIDLRGALVSLLVFAALYFIATTFAWQWSVGGFVLGWVFQLVGHRIEGSKPKFLENLIYLLVGPLYIFEEGVDALARCF